MKITTIAAMLLVGVTAFAASPAFENFNPGDFTRSGNTVKLPATLTNKVSGANVVGAISGSAATAVIATNIFGGYSLLGTNYTEDRTTLYVTGNPSALVNGLYRRHWYDSTLKQGVWTNTASTNLVYQNDPGVNIEGISFVIEGKTNATTFMYTWDGISSPSPVGIFDYWNNPLQANGASYTGTATMNWGTNTVISNPYSVINAQTNVVFGGQQSTNVMRVELWGDDTLANRTNGIPFRTPFWAMWNAQSNVNDLIKIGAGTFDTYSFYMKRGTHIEGSGKATILNMLHENSTASVYRFQSQLISVTDNCSLGNLVFSNGCVGLTQFDGFYGGTNQYIHDLWVYPVLLPTWGDDQGAYYNVGVKASRYAHNVTIERVRIYSGGGGFMFYSPEVNSTVHTNQIITLKDCEVYCDTAYSGGHSNVWLGQDWMFGASVLSSDFGVGGMIAIGFASGWFGNSYFVPGATLNVIGGYYSIINGSTNNPVYGTATNTSRNACIYISQAYDADVKINLSGNPQFVHGSTNAQTFYVLNESTNNTLQLSGLAVVKAVRNGNRLDSGTNYIYNGTNVVLIGNQLFGDGGALTNVMPYQVAYGTGSSAFSSSSMALMDFGTTDPQITVSSAGLYKIESVAGGITSSAGSGFACVFIVATNGVAVANSSFEFATIPGTLTGDVLPFHVTTMPVFARLSASDVVSLRWQSGDDSYAASGAAITIQRVSP